MTYDFGMLSVVETLTFIADADKLWSEEERLEFFGLIASEPEAGAVVKGSGGCRKVRWSRKGMGKQGGVRVIFFVQLHVGQIVMLVIYPKSVADSIPGHILKQIRREIENGHS